MLKYISCYLSHSFLVPTLSFICAWLQVYLSAAVHTYSIRMPLEGFFFVLVRISRVPLEKFLIIILIRYLCIYSSLSLSVVTTRAWIYLCSLSWSLSCIHTSESCDLLFHSDPSLSVLELWCFMFGPEFLTWQFMLFLECSILSICLVQCNLFWTCFFFNECCVL